MKVIIEIDCEHDAFHDHKGNADPWPELSRILGQLSDSFDKGIGVEKIQDTNGNTCGEITYDGF